MRYVAREKFENPDDAAGSEDARTIPADSMATSVPAPMAIPTSAPRVRGVVDAVADHRDTAAALLKSDHGLVLVGGEDLGEDLVDAKRCTDAVSDLLGVSGDHDDRHVEMVQFVDGRARFRTNLVSSASAPTTPSWRTTSRTPAPAISTHRARRKAGRLAQAGSRRSAGPPTAIGSPSTSASTPRPGGSGTRARPRPVRVRGLRPRQRAQLDARSRPRPPRRAARARSPTCPSPVRRRCP